MALIINWRFNFFFNISGKKKKIMCKNISFVLISFCVLVRLSSKLLGDRSCWGLPC